MLEEITDASPLLEGASHVAWVSYPRSSEQFCFVYPQYAPSGQDFAHVSPGAFPDRGAIYVRIEGGDAAGSVRGRYGEVVVATINIDADKLVNQRYDGAGVPDRGFAILNEHYKDSSIEFHRLEGHALGRSLVQVVELADGRISLDAPLARPVELVLDQPAPLTSWIMIEKAEGSNLVYYGPFVAQQTSSGEYKLDATPEFREHVMKLSAKEVGETISVNRCYDELGVAAKFIARAVLNRLQRRPKSVRMIDWASDAELIDAIASVIKSAQGLNMDSSAIRAAKKAILECTMATSGLYMTDERKDRMVRLLEDPLRWEGEVDVLSAALTRPPASDRLVEVALSDEYFPRVKKLFVDSEAIQEQVEAERRKYQDEAERARRARDEAIASREEARRQLAEGKAQIQKMREEALADIRSELEEAQGALERTRRDVAAAEGDLASLERQAKAVSSEIDGSSDALARRIVESHVFGRVVGASPAPAGAALPQAAVPEEHVAACEARQDEKGMSPAAIAETVRGLLVRRAGRSSLSAPDVVNILTCLMGSSMTVLSGQPGTGKTSLAVALAGALGLAGASRFVKIPVERGWTSHRDYVGYYSPLTGRLEATNTLVFEHFAHLDGEFASAGTPNGVTDASVPYLMLLDEANMSVVENYWSPFLSNADDFLVAPAELSMQGGPLLHVPSCVRWISTVNYDHTTEALSARFLNRVWVIHVDAVNLSVDELLSSEGEDGFADVPPFSYRKLMEAFGPKGDVRIEDSGTRRRMAELFELCAKSGHAVSYRCQRAIARYVAAAEPTMREFATSGGMRCLDFALAQRVLPSVNGVGDQTRKFLEGLAEACVGLDVSSERIAHMLEVGGEDGFYQFFA